MYHLTVVLQLGTICDTCSTWPICMRNAFVTFCLICCCKVWREASYDSPYRACGSGSLANSLGGANCILYARSTLASFPDTYQSSKQVVVCRLQALCFINPQHYYLASNKTRSKSPINQKKCIVANALLLYFKLDALSNGIIASMSPSVSKSLLKKKRKELVDQ